MPRHETVVLLADDKGVAQAAEALRQGQLVAYPTDTVYGLGAAVTEEAAIRRLFDVKERSLDKPLPVLIGDLSQLPLVATGIPPIASCLIARFWPGGLTLVLPRAANLSPTVVGGVDTVGVRLPDHPVARALIREAGVPIIGTSANRSGGPIATTAAEVQRQLDGRIDLILDGGTAPGGVSSTVIDLTTSEARVIRAGAISLAALRAACPELKIGSGYES